MKILLLGEYSNVHATLARGLRQLGHKVTVASNGDYWKDYPRDIDIARHEGTLGGLRLTARLISLLPRLRGYDIVQLINPVFADLKAEHLLPFYRYLRRHNRKVVLGAMGMDWYWVHTCITEKPLRYSDFNIGDQLRTDETALREQREWLGTPKERLNRLIADECDAIVTVLYEYDVCYRPHFPEKTHFIPLPIQYGIPTQSKFDSSRSTLPGEADSSGSALHAPLKVFIGISRGRSAYKGTDVLLRAIENVAARNPDRIDICKAEGVPFYKYQLMIEGSDVLLDQLYSYTPSMNTLLAMSKGIVCVGGGEPENYEIIHETELRPIINVRPKYEDVYYELEQLVQHPERLPELKRQSIEYVHRHHDYVKVARQYETLYRSLLND